MDYMLNRWPAFTRFLDDGRLCLSNNAAERALRGIARGRKTWLFAGSDEGAPCCSSDYVLTKSVYFAEDPKAPDAWSGDYQPRAVRPVAQDRHIGQSKVRFYRAAEPATGRPLSSGVSWSSLSPVSRQLRQASLRRVRPVRLLDRSQWSFDCGGRTPPLATSRFPGRLTSQIGLERPQWMCRASAWPAPV